MLIYHYWGLQSDKGLQHCTINNYCQGYLRRPSVEVESELSSAGIKGIVGSAVQLIRCMLPWFFPTVVCAHSAAAQSLSPGDPLNVER